MPKTREYSSSLVGPFLRRILYRCGHDVEGELGGTFSKLPNTATVSREEQRQKLAFEYQLVPTVTESSRTGVVLILTLCRFPRPHPFHGFSWSAFNGWQLTSCTSHIGMDVLKTNTGEKYALPERIAVPRRGGPRRLPIPRSLEGGCGRLPARSTGQTQ